MLRQGHAGRRLRRSLDALVAQRAAPPAHGPRPAAHASLSRPYTFATPTGSITFDHAVCVTCASKVCVAACVPHILRLSEDGTPVLAVTSEEASRGRCIECLACEVDCASLGAGGGRVELPIPGLDAFRRGAGAE